MSIPLVASLAVAGAHAEDCRAHFALPNASHPPASYEQHSQLPEPKQNLNILNSDQRQTCTLYLLTIYEAK